MANLNLKDLNKKLYTGELFEIWSQKSSLLKIEKYFLDKYLENKNANIIEGGTGGGRIVFEIEKLGFKKIDAFDYVVKMISTCLKKKENFNSVINFSVADASNLKSFETNRYDYLIYFEQVLCFLDNAQLPLALNEIHRIGRKESILLCSFLNWNSKPYNPLISVMVNFFRLLRREQTSKYKLPWLMLGGKFNWKFLNKNQPQAMWYKEKDIMEILEKNGFLIIESKSRLNTSEKTSHIHIACKKNN